VDRFFDFHEKMQPATGLLLKPGNWQLQSSLFQSSFSPVEVFLQSCNWTLKLYLLGINMPVGMGTSSHSDCYTNSDGV
jgi:hypothetical protein